MTAALRRKHEAVNEKTGQLLTVAAGVSLIVIHSVLMMATEGSAGWSWILLVVGVGLLIWEHGCFDATPDRRSTSRTNLE